MTPRAFIVLMLLTVAVVTVASFVAERFTQPGIERTIAVAVLTSVVVFPAAWWAERRGWIRGHVQFRRASAQSAAPGNDTGAPR